MNPTQITANSLPARGAPVRIKELEKMVADVIVETPDTTTRVLFTGNDRLEYRAGHFLTIDPTSSKRSNVSSRFSKIRKAGKSRRAPIR